MRVVGGGGIMGVAVRAVVVAVVRLYAKLMATSPVRPREIL